MDRPRAARHRILPPTFKDPVGLAVRILRSKDRAAYFAVGATTLSVLATPLDLLLALAERRLYARAAKPRKPIIFVTGAPRSGTTVLSQVLLEHLPVTYFNNLTQVFPRAPIVANRLFGRFLRRPAAAYHSFYGRTLGLAGANDGLHLWDRWWGPSRYVVPERFDAGTADDLVRFFGAYEAAFGKPILNKSNGLATCASLIARTLETSHFIFVQRDPAFNVQSILTARERIQGSINVGYGVQDPQRAASGNAIEDACAQVRYHDRRSDEQRREIGDRRFWVVRYEDFCREPYRLVERIADEILGVRLDRQTLRASLPALRSTNRVTIAPAEFAHIQDTLRRLGGADSSAATEAGVGAVGVRSPPPGSQPAATVRRCSM